MSLTAFNYNLTGKKALITGASKGIGYAIAKLLGEQGVDVVIHYNRNKIHAEDLCKQLMDKGITATILQGDLSQKNAATTVVQGAIDALSGLDILVNNAGADILTGKQIDALSAAEKLNKVIAVDLLGTIHCCWESEAHFLSHPGVIINMAWDLALHGMPGRNPQIFGAAKAGIIGFSKSFAHALAPVSRVNIIAPGWIETEFAQHHIDDEYYQARQQEIPMQRFGSVEEIAKIVAFVASPKASYITGEMIKVNGGLC